MPIHIEAEFRPLNQIEFGKVAYRVMGHVFQAHRDLGRRFDETTYQIEVASRMPDARIEVPVVITWDTFRRESYLDLLVAGGAIFEFRADQRITPWHRAQLLTCLMLTGSAHGKLVNFRADGVEHEFVNTSWTLHDRTQFTVDVTRWSEGEMTRKGLREWVEVCLRDWGTGLDLPLYEDAVAYFYGGWGRVQAEAEIFVGPRVVGQKPVALAERGVAFKVTTLDLAQLELHGEQLQRFLNHTSLRRFSGSISIEPASRSKRCGVPGQTLFDRGHRRMPHRLLPLSVDLPFQIDWCRRARPARRPTQFKVR